MKIIIYGDFNCLYCHLASQRAGQLVRAGTTHVEWRAVEHRPRTATSAPALTACAAWPKSWPGRPQRAGRSGAAGLIGQTGQSHHRPFGK